MLLHKQTQPMCQVRITHASESVSKLFPKTLTQWEMSDLWPTACSSSQTGGHHRDLVISRGGRKKKRKKQKEGKGEDSDTGLRQNEKEWGAKRKTFHSSLLRTEPTLAVNRQSADSSEPGLRTLHLFMCSCTVGVKLAWPSLPFYEHWE